MTRTPSPKPERNAPAPARRGRSEAEVDTSWVAPDPPPIPDRISKQLEPRQPVLPPLPRIRGRVRVRLGRLRRRRIAAAVVVLLIGAGLWAFWPAAGLSDVERQRWERLCDDTAAWFGPLRASLRDRDYLVMADLGFDGVIAELKAAEAFDPRAIAAAPEAPLAQLRDDPPAEARTPEAIETTRRAEAALRRVESAFADWPAHADLRAHHDLLVDRGWTAAAAEVSRVLADAPPHGRAPVGEALHALALTEPQTAAIAAACAALRSELDRLADHDEPMFDAVAAAYADLDDAAPDHANGDALERLRTRLQALEAFAARMVEMVESGRYAALDHEQLWQRGESYALLAETPAGRLPTEAMRRWLEEAPGYVRVDEAPAGDWAATQRDRLAEVDRRLQTLQDASHPSTEVFAKRRARLGAALVTLEQAPALESTRTENNLRRRELARRIDDLARATDRLTRRLAAEDAAEAMRQRPPLTAEAFASPAVERRWRDECGRLADRLLDDLDIARAEAELDRTRAALLRLIDPSEAGALPPAAAYETGGRDEPTAALLASLNAFLPTHREATLAEAVAYGVPRDDDAWSASRERWREAAAAADALAAEARTVEAAVRGVAAMPGDVFADGAAPWAETVLWRDPAVAAAGTAVADRAVALRLLATLDRWDVLSQIALDADEPATAFAAWRRLGELDWPPAGSALDVELTLRGHLARLTEAVADAGRARELRDELAAAGPARWQRVMAATRDAAQVDAVAQRAEAHGVDDEDLPPAMRFNLRLHRLRATLDTLAGGDGGPRDTEVLALSRAWLAQTAASGVADHPDLAPTLAALAGYVRPGAADRERLDAAGPAAAGWAWQREADGRVVAFTRGGWTQRFVRIDPGSGRDGVFYLSVGELPVGLALAAADWAERETQWAATMPGYRREDPRKGPRSWTLDRDARGVTTLRLNPGGWLTHAAYADATPSPPAGKHPLNYVSAEGAAYAAALLGCRLPTVAQWTAALSRYPVAPGELPNLRDTTWARHAQHAAGLIAAGRADVAWADADTFRARPRGDAAAPAADHHPINDGTLWFKPVDPTDGAAPVPARPVHLIGNVAELVTLVPVDPAPLLDDRVPIDERRDAFRRQHKNAFAVVGGSALSPASLRPESARAFNVFAGARGYADVGLRLAFAPAYDTPAQQAERALRELDYLPMR
ncbi:MAG: hypothetical protein AAF710_02205 [Planctomycetota bacterium]